MTDALLALIAVLLAGLAIQSRLQHKELIAWLDAYAEMMGEAIDSWRKSK